MNVNYVGSRVAALPATVKLEVSDDVSVQEQLRDVLTANSVKLIDLFREWDDDGNGAHAHARTGTHARARTHTHK